MSDLLGHPLERHGPIGAHQSAASDSEVWLTPAKLIHLLGPFDLDPAAAPEPRPWPIASRHYTKADNGLLRPWSGRVWLNPPYGGPGIVEPWVQRLADHGDGILLIFSRTETEWFHDQIWSRASAILFLRGRLHFHYPDGRRAKGNAGAPSCLAAYGHINAERLAMAQQPGHLVRLR